jgi:hypothetical protein
MNGTFETTGGVTVGWVNASWPFAKLTATQNSLRIVVRLLGNYSFTPETVVAITRYSVVPILGWGIQIQHCVPEYPERFTFWCIGNPDALLTGIRESGFHPQAPVSSMPPRNGFALRWQAIAVALVAWNGLFILDMVLRKPTPPLPGPLSLLALGLTLAAGIAAIRVPAFQRLILKPGRSIGEVRPVLNFFLFITGIMFPVVLLIAILKR